MTYSHRCYKAVVGVVALIKCSITPFFPPVGDKSVDMETLVDDFVTFFVGGMNCGI